MDHIILSYKLDRFDETFPQRRNIEFLDNVLAPTISVTTSIQSVLLTLI